MSETSSAQRRALLIVDHGTRSAEANLRLAAFPQQVASARPEWRVTHAHMELAQPDMPTAIDALVAEGAVEIHIHLHFLSAGYHVRETIPELVEAARARHTQIDIRVFAPIGEDPRLVDIVIDQIDRTDH
ncbi:MAG: sirohydrochlorin chelatase [bacterium]